MSNFRRYGVVKRRETGIKHEISRRSLHYEKAMDDIARIFKVESYIDRTLKEYRRHWKEFFGVIDKEDVFDVKSSLNKNKPRP
ncbi:hypothetical protein F3157_11780 [Virgibacillus dakarensis]|uniref:Uncharacterized protein n=1 Tax=Lentibacillus populi TaxID=1827502 RepID=A0A9W5X6R4_9BACI|nr:MULTISPECIES: hypothetical protein [Bacillaceae]MBT2216153.1 hypothetical protein [Virgibacillus dakarensis]MTW86331.1 hypothetical protein [Virgibacillus dakarensis]GGB54056.1 hypothetical protein GCM10011409_34630 [Lentibacillus populi]